LNLSERFDKPALETACQQALLAHLLSYREVKHLLDGQIEAPNGALPAHDHIRGGKYYQ
jgi:hypothetical protein